MYDLQRLNAGHLEAVLAFEIENRAYFARSITDRGDEFYEMLPQHHRAMLVEQETGLSVFSVLVDHDGSVVGTFNLRGLESGAANVGYRVAERVAGHGVATTALRELCRRAGADHGLTELRAVTSDANVASRRVLEKVGFRSAGRCVVGGQRGMSFSLRLPDASASMLGQLGIVLVRDPFAHVEDAWRAAQTIVSARVTADERVEVIGDFVLPAPGGPPSREFQTLHFDFGLPLVPAAPTDVARFTALHVHAVAPDSEALTRLVPLRPLLATRGWPDRDELIRRWAAYGVSHGAWAGSAGYLEGSLARVVEAASGEEPELPSVKSDGGFLCGTEFHTLDDEHRFLSERGLYAGSAAVEICLRPGELLVFDNLTVAHGRRGRRRPGELHQRVFGHPRASIARQHEIRERILAAFAP